VLPEQDIASHHHHQALEKSGNSIPIRIPNREIIRKFRREIENSNDYE
jgi:hypothetical protein